MMHRWVLRHLAAFAAAIVPLCAALAADAAADYDVIVAGGGPAGIGAGYMAAKRGARTLVLEKSGRLGGMAVNALVSPFSVFTSSPFVNDLAKRIGFGGSVDFHMADVRAFDVLTEAGADVMLHADVLGPVLDGERVTGLRVNCVEGEKVFKAKVVIDATGNGIVAAAAEAVKRGIDVRAVDARNLCLFDGAAEQKQVKDK